MPEDDAPWRKKQIEYEEKKARAKALRLRLTCTICGARPKTLLNCPCGTTQYCSTECQRIDWRDRGHRAACKKIRNERAAEAARAEAPTPPPSPPPEVFYGPAPRSHADEVRARIAAEHEAARARREAEPEPEPVSARIGLRCPICLEDWDINGNSELRSCCCRQICVTCREKIQGQACPLCRTPCPEDNAEELARLRRHVENEVPEAIVVLGDLYRVGALGLTTNMKKAVKIYKRAVEHGNVRAMTNLGGCYERGHGVAQDNKKAMQLYRMASARGDALSQCNLGLLLRDEGNLEAARYHFRLAAERGYTTGEYLLGMALLKLIWETESRTDFAEATGYLVRAAAKGHEHAQAALDHIEEASRAVEEEM